MKKSYKWIGLAVLLLFIAGTVYWYKLPGKLDSFALCLKEKDAIFYGAFWCPHCQKQKQLFGKSAKFLPYVECSTSDGKQQTQVCTLQKIDNYPTWEFADGTRQTGEISLSELSQKTGCPLPP